jgi:hypothetical protein
MVSPTSGVLNGEIQGPIHAPIGIARTALHVVDLLAIQFERNAKLDHLADPVQTD